MKVLLVHSFYRSENPSGENRVYHDELTLLEANGIEVRSFTRKSDDMLRLGPAAALLGALSTPWNPRAARLLRQEVDRFRPDVVHVHNTFPWISPAIFHAVGRRAARVLTLHNYRLFCPAAIPVRQAHLCTECIDQRSVWPALRHACYRNSRVATLPLAAGVALHRALGTWTHEVDAFITLSEFQRRLMVGAGLPAEKVHIKPNFVAGNPPVVDWDQRGNYAIFVGRLSSEKGLRTLLQAWRQWGAGAPELRIVGDGPMRAELEAEAAGSSIRFLGRLENGATRAQIGAARLLIMPSEWIETFGLALAEAFAFGTPVAVSDIGPLSTIARDGQEGVVFPPGDAPRLLHTVRRAWNDPELLRRLGGSARLAFETLYNEAANFRDLMQVYERAMQVSRHE